MDEEAQAKILQLRGVISIEVAANATTLSNCAEKGAPDSVG